jgi:peptidoglycan-associated lipoprotein
MKFHRLLLSGLLALVAAGCASTDIPDPEAQTGSGFETDDSMADTDGFGDSGMGVGEEFGDEFGQDDDMTMVIYFDFDQSELRAEYSDLLARHAANLANNRRSSVRLEGHTDERGSREYNIGLGERRSQSVRRLLLIQGASAEQISTVSFGEERPAAFGSDEEAHQLNRRVEIKYTN